MQAYIVFAQTGKLDLTLERLLETFRKDTSRLDVMQEIGKIYYYQRNYEKAYAWYNRFLNIKQQQDLNIYPFENAKIAVVMDKLGYTQKADSLFAVYYQHAVNDMSIYRPVSLAAYYAYHDSTKKSLDQLQVFTENEEPFYYWLILFLDRDPLFDSLSNTKEFRHLFGQMENSFKKQHAATRRSLERKGLI